MIKIKKIKNIYYVIKNLIQKYKKALIPSPPATMVALIFLQLAFLPSFPLILN